MKNLKLVLFLLLIQGSCLNNDNESKMTKEAEKFMEESSDSLEEKKYLATLVSARKALKIFEKQKDTTGIVNSLYLLSRASALSGSFEDAVFYGERGSKLCKEKINYPVEYKINNTLSWAYFTLNKDFNENLEHQKRQLFVVNQMKDDEAKALVYNNYGYDATVAGILHLEDAIKYMVFANDYYAKTENSNGRWYTLMNLTWQYRLKGDFKKSEYYGKLSVKQAAKDSDRHAIIEANTNLGETFLVQNKINEATPLYKNIEAMSSEKKDRDKYVFDIYYSKYLWSIGKKEIALLRLENAIMFLESSEVFYEMFGRALLAKYTYEMREFNKAQAQIDVFKNPRSNYISLESKILASTIEAKLLSKSNSVEAINLLNSKLLMAEKIGAYHLEKELKNTIRKIKN